MPPRPAILRLTSIVVLALAWGVLSRPAAAGPATALIERFNVALISIMKTDDRGANPGRYQKLNERVSEAFNLPAMMQKATGSRWRAASEIDRAHLVDAFLRMSIGTYLVRFEDYSGEYFETIGEHDRPDGTTFVVTRLVRPGNIDIPVTYVTQKFDNDWRIVDLIVAGGISELAVRKSEFAYSLSRGGLPGLIARLNEQADKILAQLPPSLRRGAAAPKTVVLDD